MPTIDSLLAEPKLLPQIPEVMRDLIQTFNEKDPDLLKISKLINKDPVISAKLLRLANSAKFGSSRQIGTVNEAAVRLGLAMVRNMVLACGLTESVTAVPGIDLKHFWGCVFNVAELARRLAVKKGMKGDEVFTCALLYDLGRLVMHVGLPENTVHHIHDLELHKGRAKAEELVVGFNYAQVGAAMARYWKFPETISNAVEYHYNPMLAKEFSAEAGLIHLAIVLAAQSDVGEEAPPEWPAKVAEKLGLSWVDCAAQFTALREQGNGYAGLLAA
ncbi:HDOD domain-containing protein [Aeromonas jandaei]|uniref:HDOD domain-containing protein n=1 Tax=Aeromonas jandaei TaxID=650 RepID=UPI000F52F32F|nr:HDOD domain-containing protein [Aeromonas jandaei]MBL0668324.1 HDOD domain-containing protein [Aeromonas jandaei]RQM73419.1 HDOD domain-containing protein [Aeromonas jandaei]